MQTENFTRRKAEVYKWLEKENLDAVLIEDTEGRQTPTLRYLCGMPSDALLLLTAAGKSILVAWDIHLAEQLGEADVIVAYSDFERRIEIALRDLAVKELSANPKIELSSATPVPVFEKIGTQISGEVFCRDGGVDALLDGMRAVKDEEELSIYRETAKMTAKVREAVVESFQDKTIQSELDIAFLLELKARQLGAEGTGFPTLAAGPERSFAIHPFPNYTNGPWGTDGLSILDFGISFEGYTTDVTLTLAKGELSGKQKEMLDLVESAYNLAVEQLKPGVSTLALAKSVDDHFKQSGYTMPHALGHGIGLAAHETPTINLREINAVPLEPGMIVTIEPGLYDKDAGGVRLENNFLVTDSGYEQLTASRIYKLP